MRAVIVTLKDDQSSAIKGVLWSSRGAWLVFRDAALLKPNLPATSIDGELVIARNNVLFMQVLP